MNIQTQGGYLQGLKVIKYLPLLFALFFIPLQMHGQELYTKNDLIWQKVQSAFYAQSLDPLEEFFESEDFELLSELDKLRVRMWKSALANDLSRDNSPLVIDDFENWLIDQSELTDEELLELYLIQSSLLNISGMDHTYEKAVDSLVELIETLPEHLELFYTKYTIFQYIKLRDYRGAFSIIQEFQSKQSDLLESNLDLIRLHIAIRRVECLAFTGASVEALNESRQLKIVADSLFEIRHHWRSTIDLLHANVLFMNGQIHESIAALESLVPNIDTTGYGIGTYISAQNSLGVTKKNIHDPDAFKHYAKVLEAFQFLGDTINPNYCMTLNNMASHFRAYRLYDKTIDFAARALECLDNLPGLDPINFLDFYRNYANGLKNVHRFEEAYEAVLIALEGHRDVLQRTDELLLADHFTIFRVLFMMGRVAEAHAYLEDALRIHYYFVWNITPRLPEQRQAFFLRRNIYNPDFTWHHKKGYKYQDQAVARSVAEMILNFSDLLEHSIRENLFTYRFAGDQEFEKLMSELRSLRAAYAAANMQRAHSKKDSLAKVIIELEDQFDHRYFTQKRATTSTFRDWIEADVLTESLEDEALVLFIKSNISETFEGPKKPVYGALVINPFHDSLAMINLGSSSKIDSIILSSGIDQQRSYLNDKELNNQLYNLLWAPLTPHLSNVEQVFMRPAGLLHNVSFGALLTSDEDDTDHFIMEKYLLRYISHPHHLIERKEQEEKIVFDRGIVLFGNPDFDHFDGTHSHTSLPLNFNTRSFSVGDKFDFLPGTELEISAIKSEAKKVGLTAKAFTGSNATKNNFISLEDIQPGILHVSTHGYFDQSMAADMTGLNSPRDVFINNGLALSGANKDLEALESEENITELLGIITAYEIAGMNLSGTELIVLSACESAIGPALVNEGIYGLQRAFRLAGSNKLLGSLWSIPDEQTSEFMIQFYTNLFSGQSTYQALRNAQLSFSDRYPPYYWAGFVLVE